MDDSISRRAAIETVVAEGRTVDSRYLESERIIHESDAVEALSMLPSVRSEPRWIPVTERLPKIDMTYPHHDDYLVQYDSGDMDVASWSNVNRFWTDHVTEPHWNCVQFAIVVAWMPLPEPYRKETEDAVH